MIIFSVKVYMLDKKAEFINVALDQLLVEKERDLKLETLASIIEYGEVQLSPKKLLHFVGSIKKVLPFAHSKLEISLTPKRILSNNSLDKLSQ